MIITFRRQEATKTENDETLYRHYISGDDHALRDLLERHREGLILFAYGIVGNMEDAEDIMLDAFATLASGEAKYSGRSTFKTWLFAIAHNKAVSFLRKKRITTVALNEKQLSDYAADFEVLHEDRRRKIMCAMEKLKSEYRQALTLAYFEDMNREQIASVMKITKRQASDFLYRGKQALKLLLEQEGITNAELG